MNSSDAPEKLSESDFTRHAHCAGISTTVFEYSGNSRKGSYLKRNDLRFLAFAEKHRILEFAFSELFKENRNESVVLSA